MAKYNYNFGKLNENGGIEYAPIPLVIDGENVWTNLPEVYTEQGYYPITKTEMPEKEGFYFTSYYVLEENAVIQKWEEHEIPEEPEIPIEETATEEEINEAIREGVNSIDY